MALSILGFGVQYFTCFVLGSDNSYLYLKRICLFSRVYSKVGY